MKSIRTILTLIAVVAVLPPAGEVAAWGASFGGAVRAIEPPALVEAVRKLHEDGLRAHGTANSEPRGAPVSPLKPCKKKKQGSAAPLTSIVNDRWQGGSTGE